MAAYRQTVLQAFQEVEDNLVALRVLADEERVQREVLDAARVSLDIVTLQYKAGTVSYLDVIQAQTTVLQAEQAVLSLHGRRLGATVDLIRATGGGWWRTGESLPSAAEREPAGMQTEAEIETQPPRAR